MNLIWNDENVRIPDQIVSEFVGSELRIKGTGDHNGRMFVWMAVVTPSGWYVDIYQSTGRVGGMQGATFNLPLEVASIVRRVL